MVYALGDMQHFFPANSVFSKETVPMPRSRFVRADIFRRHKSFNFQTIQFHSLLEKVPVYVGEDDSFVSAVPELSETVNCVGEGFPEWESFSENLGFIRGDGRVEIVPHRDGRVL